MRSNDYNVHGLKLSVKDLAAKTKHLKGLKNELKRKRRAGDPHPVEHKTSEGALVLLDMPAVLGKIATRASCSRYHQLAYGYARGMPYRKIEATTRPGNRPSVTVLVEVLKPFIQADRVATANLLPTLLDQWLSARTDTCLSALSPAAA